MKLSDKSLARLNGVHHHLQLIMARAADLSQVDFRITEGVRTRERQQQLFDAGASQTMNSRHLTGHAVDVAAEVGGKVRWDWPLYHLIAAAVKSASTQLSIPIVWGGDWKHFKDGPHFELPRDRYP